MYRIKNKKQAQQVRIKLKQKFPPFRMNFDLEDCDTILRIENTAEGIHNKAVIHLFQGIGYFIEISPDTNT